LTVLLDARLSAVHSLRADIAIIGAGAAGMAIACELEGAGISVLLLESGGRRLHRESQALNEAETLGLRASSPKYSRFRCLGGSTARWGGQCRPLDAVDFEPRFGSGWPFSLDEMRPYYRRAADICRLPVSFDDTAWSVGPFATPPRRGNLEKITYLFSYPRDFGQLYTARLAASQNVRVLLHATVTHIQLARNLRTVSGLTMVTSDGKQVQVSAGRIVLAGGGIENARLLLASNDVARRGIGNEHDLVGRYFMDHPYAFVGVFSPRGPHPDIDSLTIDGYDGVGVRQKSHAALTLSDARIAGGDINRCSLYLIRRPFYKCTREYLSPAGRSLTFLVDVLRRREAIDRPLRLEIARLLARADHAALTLGRAAGHALHPKHVLAARIAMESRPIPDSRITLAGRRDKFGVPLARIHWRLSDADKRGVRALLEEAANAFAASGLGTMREFPWDPATGWPSGMTSGKHHMGTTRMHADPKGGVVDANARVHETDNLYIAGSSVFPTAGYANPTLSIVALSLRLARHVLES
jgi:choline dehydrogenase-like flavoprotein